MSDCDSVSINLNRFVRFVSFVATASLVDRDYSIPRYLLIVVSLMAAAAAVAMRRTGDIDYLINLHVQFAMR
jgi:hypothetical protein